MFHYFCQNDDRNNLGLSFFISCFCHDRAFLSPFVSVCPCSSEPLRFQINQKLHAAEKVIEVD